MVKDLNNYLVNFISKTISITTRKELFSKVGQFVIGKLKADLFIIVEKDSENKLQIEYKTSSSDLDIDFELSEKIASNVINKNINELSLDNLEKDKYGTLSLIHFKVLDKNNTSVIMIIGYLGKVNHDLQNIYKVISNTIRLILTNIHLKEELQLEKAEVERTIKTMTFKLSKDNKLLKESIKQLEISKKQLNHINRLLRGIRSVNQLIVQEEKPKELIEKASKILTENLGYKSVWIALFDESMNKVNTSSFAGFKSGIRKLKERLNKGNYTKCMNMAINQDNSIIIYNPLSECKTCPLAEHCKNFVILCRRLFYKNNIYGVINVSTPSEFINEEEIELFTELVTDLSFAFYKISLNKKLMESEEKYRYIFERSVEGIYLHDLNGKIIDVNKIACEQLGYTKEELLKLTVFDFHPEKKDAEVLPVDVILNLWKSWKEGQVHRIETKHKKKDGTVFPVEILTGIIKLQGQKYILAIVQDITERKKLLNRLAKEEYFIKTLMDNIPDSIYFKDRESKFIRINKSLAKKFGLRSPEEAIGMTDFDFFSEEHASQSFKDEQKIIKTGKPIVNIEEKETWPDGRVTWVSTTKMPLYDKDKNIIGTFGISRDVTALKKAEEKIKESEETYRNLFHNAQVGLFRTRISDGKILESNEQLAKMFGYDNREEFIAEYVTSKNYVDSGTREKMLKEIMEKGYIKNFKARFYKRDGTIFWAKYSAKIYPEKGWIEGVAEDITNQVLLEQALIKEENFLESVLESIQDGISVLNTDLTIKHVNSVMKKWYSKNLPLEGKKCFKVYHDANEPCDPCPTIRCLQTGKTEREVVPGLPGSDQWIELFSYPMKDPETGKITGVVEFVRDITALKKAEEEKTKLLIQLAQAQKMEAVGRLAGGIAHDFNNMLTIIKGYTELALNRISHDNPLNKNLKEILKAANRSSDLVKQLLGFARKQIVKPEVLNLNETIESMIKLLSKLIGEDIELIWIPGKDLYDVKIDPSQVDQILTNLCTNARDAIRPGVGKIIIETDNVYFDESYCKSHPFCSPGDYVMLSVSDNGRGIDKETLQHIFEPFFTTKNIGGGTGLGLSTVYGIVKQNNGYINAYSEPGKGTTIKVYFPKYKGEKSSVKKAEKEANLFGNETILIVEDEESILNMSKIGLEKYGYNVLTANSPNDAIQLVKSYKGNIDILITDVVMPQMNGRELANKIRSFYKNLKVIYTSGYTANVVIREGIVDQEINFIQKPYSIEELLSKVREVLKVE